MTPLVRPRLRGPVLPTLLVATACLLAGCGSGSIGNSESATSTPAPAQDPAGGSPFDGDWEATATVLFVPEREQQPT